MQVETGDRGRPRVKIATMAGEGPRFRRDLDAKPLEIDGIAYVDTTDPRSGSIFRFYDFEHAVAEALDGRELDDVVSDARARSGFEVTVEPFTYREGSNISVLSARHRDAYRRPSSHHDDHELATEARDAGFGAVVA